MVFEAWKSGRHEHLDVVTEAQEKIFEMYEKGIRPVVTVKKKWAHTLEKGLPKHTSWIPEFNEIVGTMGTDPYIPNGEDRLIVEVHVQSPEQIQPRLTGPDKGFHGIVVLIGPIPPSSIRIRQKR